jgi:hypothetical protein
MSTDNHSQENEVMGISPKNAEGQKQMSDVAMARSYVADIGGSARVKVMLANAYDRLRDMFPHTENPENQWTERRLRAFWNEEAATVQFREMVELHRAAENAIAERKMLEIARKEHADFIEKTARLRSLLEHQDQDFHSHQIEGMGCGFGRMAGPGTDSEH